MEPNRTTGGLIGIEKCPHRAIPCGNPIDADEAMRAKQILLANPSDPIAAEQAKQALKHAISIASHCNVEICPLESYFATNRLSALKILAKTN